MRIQKHNDVTGGCARTFQPRSDQTASLAYAHNVNDAIGPRVFDVGV